MSNLVLTVVVAALAGASGDLKDLGFLEGEWRGESGGAVIEERWTDGAGGTMLGLSRTLSSGKIAAFEFLRIEARADGVFYVAKVAQRIAKAGVKAFDADGVTIQQFNEAAGGQVVFHLHVHVIPRHDGVALKPPASVKEAPEVLAEHARKLAAAL